MNDIKLLEQCPACGENQFSSDEKAEKDPCIKCGHPGTELQADLRIKEIIIKEDKDGGYIAYNPEMDCYGDGETPQEALADIMAVTEDLTAIAESMEPEGDI